MICFLIFALKVLIEMQPVVFFQRPAVKTADFRGKIRARAAQPVFDHKTAFDRQISAAAENSLFEFQNASFFNENRSPVFDQISIAMRAEVRAAERDERIFFKFQNRRGKMKLQNSFRFGIAEENIYQPRRPPVHRAVRIDAETPEALSSQILNSR